MPIKHILVPLDFTISSNNALNYALNLSAILNSKILLFHCYKYPVVATDIPIEHIEEMVNQIEMNCHQQLADAINYANKINNSVKIDYILQHGDFIKKINTIIKEKSIDLILMGTQGAEALKALFFGTHAGKVIDKTLCPALVIPEHCTFNPIKNILYPSEYLDSDIYNLQTLVSIANSFDANIIILNISQDEKFIQRFITKEFEKEVKTKINYAKMSFITLNEENIYQSIIDYSEMHNIDLLVMSTRQRKFFENLYDHSLTKRIAYHTNIPLLAFHAEKIYQEEII